MIHGVTGWLANFLSRGMEKTSLNTDFLNPFSYVSGCGIMNMGFFVLHMINPNIHGLFDGQVKEDVIARWPRSSICCEIYSWTFKVIYSCTSGLIWIHIWGDLASKLWIWYTSSNPKEAAVGSNCWKNARSRVFRLTADNDLPFMHGKSCGKKGIDKKAERRTWWGKFAWYKRRNRQIRKDTQRDPMLQTSCHVELLRN